MEKETMTKPSEGALLSGHLPLKHEECSTCFTTCLQKPTCLVFCSSCIELHAKNALILVRAAQSTVRVVRFPAQLLRAPRLLYLPTTCLKPPREFTFLYGSIVSMEWSVDQPVVRKAGPGAIHVY